MKIDNNLIIICVTVMISIHMIMRGLFNIANAKNAGQVMTNNFQDVLKNMEKIEKIKKGME